MYSNARVSLSNDGASSPSTNSPFTVICTTTFLSFIRFSLSHWHRTPKINPNQNNRHCSDPCHMRNKPTGIDGVAKIQMQMILHDFLTFHFVNDESSKHFCCSCPG